MNASRFRFSPLVEADLTLLYEWLQRPHLQGWWENNLPPSLAEVRAKYLPRIGNQGVRCFLAYLNDAAVGYIQSYVAMTAGKGWWPDENDAGVVGIDQFLADPAQLGRGIGTAMVSQFVNRLFADSRVTRIQADPHPDNTRSIRCLEKAGFVRVGPIATPDGPALLMTHERPTLDRTRNKKAGPEGPA
jgi:RimJ/RimL family protein N-acetyltransferase